MNEADHEVFATRISHLEGVVMATRRWEDVGRLLFEAQSVSDGLDAVADLLSITPVVARTVVNTQWRRLTRDERAKLDSELADLRQQLADARS